jgi:alcohol dehydrogenase
MIAAVLGRNEPPRIEERPAPVAPSGEALVRVLLAGVCATDLELAKGYMGFAGVAGHEFVGEVVSAPSAAGLEGARVVGEINAGCGACALCREGLERHCPSRTVLGIVGRPGAFAEYVTLPVRSLHRLPAGLPIDRALFTEPVAAAFEVVEQVPVDGRRVLVLGDGKLGSLVARVLDLRGAEVTVLGRHARKLAPLAADGFSTILDGRDPSPSKKSFPIVVEATGAPDGLERALELVRPRGTIVLKTTCAGARPMNLAPVVIDEVTVVGSRCGPFAPALDALARGALRPEDTIDARFPLREIGRALEAAAAPGVRKVVIEVGS